MQCSYCVSSHTTEQKENIWEEREATFLWYDTDRIGNEKFLFFQKQGKWANSAVITTFLQNIEASLIWLQIRLMKMLEKSGSKTEKLLLTVEYRVQADEPLVCSDRTWQFLQTCMITLKNQCNFCVLSTHGATEETVISSLPVAGSLHHSRSRGFDKCSSTSH
jgi:hypothetical protein